MYADFNNADTAGRVRLNGRWSLRDIDRLGVTLHDAMEFTIHDEEFVADGVAAFSADERVWAVRIDWNAVRPWVGEPTASAIG